MKFPILLTNYGYWKSLPLIFQICIFYGSVFITYFPFDCGSCRHVTWYAWYFLCMTTWRNSLKLRVMLFSFRKDIYIYLLLISSEVGADHLHPSRDWANWKLSFSLYKGQSISSIFPLQGWKCYGVPVKSLGYLPRHLLLMGLGIQCLSL